jgi:hypothetical protein
MATKKTGDVPVSEPEPTKPVKEPGDVPDSTPEPTPEPSDIPDRFQGKKLEDVIGMVEKTEKERDRSGTEVGTLRKETDELRNNLSYFQNVAQDLQSKLEKGGKPESQPDVQFNYDNPLPSIREVVQSELKRDRETRNKADGERENQRASMNFATGRGKAMENNPELFRGVEREVEQGMWQYYKSGRISADELRDPESWENGARIFHLSKKDWDRIAPPKVEPVSSTPTEKPNAAKVTSPEEGVSRMELDDFGKEMLDHAVKSGIDEKEFYKQVKEMKKREG